MDGWGWLGHFFGWAGVDALFDNAHFEVLKHAITEHIANAKNIIFRDLICCPIIRTTMTGIHMSNKTIRLLYRKDEKNKTEASNAYENLAKYFFCVFC